METIQIEKEVKIFRDRIWKCEKHDLLVSARKPCVDCQIERLGTGGNTPRRHDNPKGRL